MAAAPLSNETIFALSTGALPSGIAIVRISGEQAAKIVAAVFGRVPPARHATFGVMRSREGGVLDHGICLYFEASSSFTGEPSAEFHLHGGRAVVAAMLSELSGFEGTRPAEAGEFTRRAFLNGKMDLTESEALADLVDAETDLQRRFALENSRGGQGRLYDGWRDRIVHARAMIEAELDFADEGDIPGSVSDTVWKDMAALRRDIEVHLSGFHTAEIIREGYRVVLLGAPNAGKSSLLNALARRDVAIVTDEPGTTRDLIDVSLDLNGVKVIVTDTAGIRTGATRVEAIGIEKALARAEDADLVLRLSDLSAEQESGLNLASGRNVLSIGTKLDLTAGSDRGLHDLDISTVTGEGMDELVGRMSDMAAQAANRPGGLLPARQRHVTLLNSAVSALDRAARPGEFEFRAEELRTASDAIGRITGRIEVEELLGAIFSRFCVGK